MNHVSLFSGIGGFDLAAEWMGWHNVAHCEINQFCQKILKYYWPQADSYSDITQTDFTKYEGLIDILTGGFPCQPYSVAGKRKGKEDARHLWPEMLRAIREIKPIWVVGENVRGLISWDEGLVFHEVQSDLEAEGYEVLPVVLPAASINAPHRRERVWFIAFNAANARRLRCNNRSDNWQTRHVQGDIGLTEENKPERKGRERWPGQISTIAADSQNVGCPLGSNNNTGNSGQFHKGQSIGNEAHGGKSFGHSRFSTDTASYRRNQDYRFGEAGLLDKESPYAYWGNFPTQSPVCNGDDGFPAGMDAAAFSRWRNKSIQGGGNAIVPQVAYQIFRTIELYDLLY